MRNYIKTQAGAILGSVVVDGVIVSTTGFPLIGGDEDDYEAQIEPAMETIRATNPDQQWIFDVDDPTDLYWLLDKPFFIRFLRKVSALELANLGILDFCTRKNSPRDVWSHGH